MELKGGLLLLLLLQTSSRERRIFLLIVSRRFVSRSVHEIRPQLGKQLVERSTITLRNYSPYLINESDKAWDERRKRRRSRGTRKVLCKIIPWQCLVVPGPQTELRNLIDPLTFTIFWSLSRAFINHLYFWVALKLPLSVSGHRQSRSRCGRGCGPIRFVYLT